MHDQPDPPEILAAATAFLRSEIIPALPPDLSFKTRVLANALDLVARQVGQLAPDDGQEADIVRRIETGDVDLMAPALIARLWATTLAKLAVDQPNYASYRSETDAAGLQE